VSGQLESLLGHVLKSGQTAELRNQNSEVGDESRNELQHSMSLQSEAAAEAHPGRFSARSNSSTIPVKLVSSHEMSFGTFTITIGTSSLESS
jgi:hypothetical protein